MKALTPNLSTFSKQQHYQETFKTSKHQHLQTNNHKQLHKRSPFLLNVLH